MAKKLNQKFAFKPGENRFPTLEKWPDNWDGKQLFIYVEEKDELTGIIQDIGMRVFYNADAVKKFMSEEQYEQFKQYLIEGEE